MDKAIDTLLNKTGEAPVFCVAYAGEDQTNGVLKGKGEHILQLLMDTITGNDNVSAMLCGAFATALCSDDKLFGYFDSLYDNILKVRRENYASRTAES